jgi:predicted phage terminase large subunit-like protein
MSEESRVPMEVTETPAATTTTSPSSDPDFVTFWEFFQTYVAENRIDLPLKPCHRQICDTLQEAFCGNLPAGIEYILIEMPPRIGKSTILQAWPAWALTVFPDSQWIYTSYNDDLAKVSVVKIGTTLSRPWYRDTFGDYLHAKRDDYVTTTEGGQIFAEGVGGGLIGKGAGLKRPAGGAFVIDDPAKPKDALSTVVAAMVQNWFENTVKNRRNSDRFCPVVACAQRLGKNDLLGYIEATYPEKCIVLRFPALVDPITGKASQADNAVSAFPETVKTETLLDYRKTRMGRFVLAAMYQQEPIALGGNLIPTGAFHRFDVRTPMKWARAVITVDTALKTKQANDFSAIALWVLFDRKAYFLDLMHGKWETPDLIANTEAFWRKWTHADCGVPRPKMIIEEKAAGTPLLQSLRKLGIPATGIERDVDKVRRVQGILQFIESGMVVIPKDGSVPWIEKTLSECDEFRADGTQSHDDIVDTMVDGIEELLGRTTSIFDVLTTRK